MKFGIITHVEHKINGKDNFAYEPYVREMNLWAKPVDEIVILAPKSEEKEISKIETPYHHTKIKFVETPSFNITTLKNSFLSLLVIPKICVRIYKVMKSVDHIHLRCPGNIGLIGCFVQMLFPNKKKTVKYAGNWDPKSKQPWSYKLQKCIISNTFLTKNCKVLVYGEWENQTKNIIPFFTASYYQNEIEAVSNKDLKEQIRLIYVGGLTTGKQPMLSVQSTHELIKKGYNIRLSIYGDGILRNKIEEYIKLHQLEKSIYLYGNQSKEIVKEAYKVSHFLLFISKSEGWPKVVAESMFWKCLPISSKVSCVPYILDFGNRGSLVEYNVSKEAIVKIIIEYIKNENKYQKEVLAAQKWSHSYTLDTFEQEIKNLLIDE